MSNDSSASTVAPAQDSAAAPSAAAPNGKRRRRIALLVLIIIAALIGYGLYWYLHGRYFESTDDAYVSADRIQITSEVAGTVVALHVDDTQHVARGQALVELDPADAQVAVTAAQAELARTVRQVRGLFSQTAGLRAQIHQHEIALNAARADLARRQSAGKDGAVSAEELQHARDQVAQLEAALNAARESLAGARAQTEGTHLATHPQVRAAAARLRDAYLALHRTRIVAPVAGTVAQRSVQIGARIAPGAPLMAVVPLADAWVDANFKEVQIEGVRIGQPVSLHADLYGDDVVYHGHVAGLGAGTGSAFALLPAQNASGNWIKIVQRVPVRISLDAKELSAHPLRVGLSMHAEIDLHDSSGPLVATQIRGAAQQTVASEAGDEVVSHDIARIIAANAGRAAP